MNLNSKYMIKMAEARGLFGSAMGEAHGSRGRGKGPKVARVRKKKSSGKRSAHFEVERIGAQTHASLMRSFDPKKYDNCCVAAEIFPCPRHRARNQDVAGTSPARQWWAETTRYLTRLRRSLVRQKLLPDRLAILDKLLPEKRDKVLDDIHNIDEILSRVPKVEGTCAKIPPFPKLRLSRSITRQERIPFPVYNCSVELPQRRYF